MSEAEIPPLVGSTLLDEAIPDAKIYILCRGTSAFADAAVWRRLVKGSFPTVLCTFLYLDIRAQDLKAALPKSEWFETAILDPTEALEQWVGTDSTLAFVREGTKAKVLIRGPVTDARWDLLEAAVY